MKFTPHIKFLLAVTLQVVILVGLFVSKSLTSLTGTEVLLKIQPVDPRDPLRGDYVTYQYEISRLPRSSFPALLFPKGPAYGEQVFVPLVKAGDYWTAGYPVLQESPRKKEAVYLKARVVDTGESDFVRLEYGLEQYFIPEGAGQRVSFFNREAFAKIRVDKFGTGVIQELLVDGKKWP